MSASRFDRVSRARVVCTAMRGRDALLLCLVLALAGCGWIEEKQKQGRRRRAETELVETVATGNVGAVREAVERDRSLANAVRWVSGRRRMYPTESALTQAVKQGRREVAAVLLDLGADPNLADGTGASPLAAALLAEKDRPAVVALLLERGADPARVTGGTTALHQAASSSSEDREETLRLLLARVSGAGGHDASGYLPLHAAARTANVPAIRLLVAKGADPSVRTLGPRPGEGMPDDVKGTTPLAIVARDRQIAAAATLCALGADPDLEDSTGISAREKAARVAAKEAAGPNPTRGDVVRHQNMASFLARGGGCDALLARRRRGETIADTEVERIANESECEAGWGWACGRAGWAFYRGEGAKEDEARSFALFRKGCETRNEWSCGMTGISYVDGRGVPENPVEGARWLAKGCEPADPKRADAQACNRLGLLYAEGSGVPKDLDRARALFKNSCDAKYERACANLVKFSSLPAR